MKKIAIVGAGFSGAVIGYQLAKAGYKVDVFEARNHIGGNCFTERDPATGVILHKYGAHIFHTNNELVWSFVTKFGFFHTYYHKVKAVANGKVYSLPINLHTINQFYNTFLSPQQAEAFIKQKTYKNIKAFKTFQDVALASIGVELYESFFKGYTAKHWGVSPDKIPSTVFKRLPVRFYYNDNYFDHLYQGIPKEGYTSIIAKMLDNENISIYLNQIYERNYNSDYYHVFYSGPLDAYFSHDIGRLGYITLDFAENRFSGDYQGCPVINYCDIDIPYTRIIEHKHLAPWEKRKSTVIHKEYSRYCESGDMPYYPLRFATEDTLLQKYVHKADLEKGVTFVGRLGTHRYIDMDVAVKEALETAKAFIQSEKGNGKLRTFMVRPS